MERLLSYYVPNITFDIQSLRQAADELKTKHRDSESDAVSTKVDANEMEDLAIDEEDFTIKALPNNQTRECNFLRYHRQRRLINCGNRIFRRVLIFKFLRENPKEN